MTTINLGGNVKYDNKNLYHLTLTLAALWECQRKENSRFVS